jgi:esterase/lipase superfamily enzyme
MRVLVNLIILGLILCYQTFGAPRAAIAQFADEQRGVPYLTLRNRTGASEPDEYYGDERSTLKAGWCGIDQTKLSVLSPVAEAAPFHIPEEILRIKEVREMSIEALFDGLKTSAAGQPPLLYTHGFYIDFDKGCRRATVFQENVGLQGQFLWFNWPSDGALLNYTRDESDLYWSVPDLAWSIAEVETQFPEVKINVAGHSLGARGLVLALYEVANQNPRIRLGEAVFLAPDIDFDIFGKILPRIRPIVSGITVYVTNSDRPLALSAQVHGYTRLGQAGNDVSRLEGVEVIDLSNLPVRSPSGHLYHLYNKEVGDDLHQLLIEGKRAEARRNLVKLGPNLWKLQAAE